MRRIFRQKHIFEIALLMEKIILKFSSKNAYEIQPHNCANIALLGEFLLQLHIWPIKALYCYPKYHSFKTHLHPRIMPQRPAKLFINAGLMLNVSLSPKCPRTFLKEAGF